LPRYEEQSFTLVDGFYPKPYWSGGKMQKTKVRSLIYTPDFIVGNNIIEIKGFETDRYKIVRKLFLEKIKDSAFDFFEVRSMKELKDVINIIKDGKNIDD